MLGDCSVVNTQAMDSDSSLSLFSFGTLFFSLVLLHVFFTAARVSAVRCRPHALEELVKAAFPGGRRAQQIVSERQAFLLSAQIGVVFTLFALGAFLWIQLPLLLATSLTSLNGDFFSFIAAFLVVGGFIIVLSEVVRLFARSFAAHVLCCISLPFLFAHFLLSPVFIVVTFFVELVKRFAPLDDADYEIAASPEEISRMLEQGMETGEIEEDEVEMIEGIFTFSETVVREVMTPRVDIAFVEQNASLQDVIKVFKKEGRSRLLVTGEDMDDVRGVLIARDLIPLLGKKAEPFRVTDYLRTPIFVQNTRKIDELLEEFQRDAVHFAVVLDEHGGVDGVVTVEDLIEEIVGEIFDEFDDPQEEAEIEATRSGDYLVDGSMPIEDLNDSLSWTLPNGEYDTVAGFVIHQLGRIPTEGEGLEYDGLRIKVEKLSQNRITLLRLQKAQPSS